MADTIEVVDRGRLIAFSFDDLMRYHGPSSPGGVAHAFKVLERALPLLDPGGPCERREIVVETAFGGPGARDAFEMVTRAVTGDRYRVDPALARPERGRTLERFVFRLGYRDRSATLAPARRLRDRRVHRPRPHRRPLPGAGAAPGRAQGRHGREAAGAARERRVRRELAMMPGLTEQEAAWQVGSTQRRSSTVRSRRCSASWPTARTIRSSVRGCSRSRRPPTGRPASGRSTRARSRTPASRPSASSRSPSSRRPRGSAGRSSRRTRSPSPTGGYDLAPEGDGTRVTLHNSFEGHGFGKLIAPLALRAARKGADDFGRAIKSAVESS